MSGNIFRIRDKRLRRLRAQAIIKMSVVLPTIPMFSLEQRANPRAGLARPSGSGVTNSSLCRGTHANKLVMILWRCNQMIDTHHSAKIIIIVRILIVFLRRLILDVSNLYPSRQNTESSYTVIHFLGFATVNNARILECATK